MNLHRLLAENMARFGTKNLSAPSLRTILNEGYAAGAQLPRVETFQIDAASGATPAIAQYLGKYASTKIQNNNGTGTLSYYAMLALSFATYAAAKADKEIAKVDKNIRVAWGPDEVWKALLGDYIVAGQGESGDKLGAAVIAKGSEITKTITYNNTTIDVYPGVKDPKRVATVGRQDGYQVNNPGVQSSSGYSSLIGYLNSFNTLNIEDDDFTQYVLSDMMTAENFVDLQIVVSANNRIYIYTAGTKKPDVAGKELTSTTVGASAPVPKQYDVSFDSGVATIPANDAEVAKAVQDAIAMFPDGNISNLTVVSSASPEYNKNAGGPTSMADYGQNTTGAGDPGAGTDDISKNKKLAYDRGVSFMNALNAGLEAQGKPAVTGYTINWQISDKGGSKVPGRYAEVQWEKAGSKGTEVPGAKSTGTAGAATDGRATYNITQHEFSW